MKVSIITVCYNSCGTIRSTIESVKAQDYQDIEYIIIDGGSFDGTRDVIACYKDVVSKFLSEEDNGIYDAMNKGIKLSTGEIIGILNSDDCYANNHVISNVVAKISCTGCDGLYGDLVYVGKNDPDKVIRIWRAGVYKYDKFKYGWMPPHPTFFVRRNIYEQYGVYNTSFKNSSDYELMLRFIHKYKISLDYLPQVLVRMAEGGMSNASLKNRIRANKEDRLAWKINHLSPFFFTLWLKPLRKLSQFSINSK